MRWLFLLLLPLGLSAAGTGPGITVEPLAVPAARGSRGPSVASAPDGSSWLTWLEPETGGRWTLRVATLAPAAAAWGPPHTIAEGIDAPGSSADFPALTVGRAGAATVVWSVNNPPVPSSGPAAAGGHGHEGPGYRAWISHTKDGGLTWSAPSLLTRESNSVEFASLVTLADGRVLAAWLDGRAKHGAGGSQQLFARIIGDQLPDTLLDPSVCDCCPTALTAFLDGGALLAYRGRNAGEVRDIRRRRFDGRAWDQARVVNEDGWRIPGCPVNGARLASDGGRVAVAWYTAAGEDPRIQASFSTDAGGTFLMPLRIDAAKPAGRVDTALLRDGAFLVTWVASDGAVWLRRVSPGFSAAESVRVAPAEAGPRRAVPRLVLRRDYAGGPRGEAEALVVFGTGGIEARRLRIPEGELLQAEANCDCAPTAEQLRGWPIRGTVVGHDVAAGRLELRHPALPGIFAAGTRSFALMLAPGVGALPAGEQVFARIEPAGSGWRIFDVRRIVTAPAR